MSGLVERRISGVKFSWIMVVLLLIGASPLRAADLEIPLEYHRLDNGLRVVLAPDDLAPTATVAVYYGIGDRHDAQGKIGIAHLFEHLMFESTEAIPDRDFSGLIKAAGGEYGGSTRGDYIGYFEVVPRNYLDRVLWAEAQRMRSIDIDQAMLDNEREIVRNESDRNYQNSIYLRMAAIWLPQAAFGNWQNGHNTIDTKDLDSITLDDLRQYFDSYYRPNNAVVVVAGDIEPSATLAAIERHFGSLPSGPVGALPSIEENVRQKQVKVEVVDPIGSTTMTSFAYMMPDRGSDEWLAMALLDVLLAEGPSSLIQRRLVGEMGISSYDEILWGANVFGNLFDYDGPMLWMMAMPHDPAQDSDIITDAVDDVIATIVRDGIAPETLAQIKARYVSKYYDIIDGGDRFGLVNILASFALFDDDPRLINRIDDRLSVIDGEILRLTAEQWLGPQKRTVVTVRPGKDAGEQQ